MKTSDHNCKLTPVRIRSYPSTGYYLLISQWSDTNVQYICLAYCTFQNTKCKHDVFVECYDKFKTTNQMYQNIISQLLPTEDKITYVVCDVECFNYIQNIYLAEKTSQTNFTSSRFKWKSMTFVSISCFLLECDPLLAIRAKSFMETNSAALIYPKIIDGLTLNDTVNLSELDFDISTVIGTDRQDFTFLRNDQQNLKQLLTDIGCRLDQILQFIISQRYHNKG